MPLRRPRHIFYAFLTLAAALLASQAAQAAPTGLLNDTGQTLCSDGTTLVACDATSTGDAATYPRQDGRFGRDVGNPPKVGGGAAGFDFTRVCMSGDLAGAGTCAPSPTAAADQSNPGVTDWACTKDNVTNLIWSLQTQSANWTTASGATYPNAGHNSLTRCGYGTGWRLPTRQELLSIVNWANSAMTIDLAYFPAAQATDHWTSDVYVLNPTIHAWFVTFNQGSTSTRFMPNTLVVRLVRSGP